MKNWIELNDINGVVGANKAGKALVRVPTEEGLRLHEISLELTATGAGQQMADHFGDITLRRGGNPQRILSVTEIDELGGFYGPYGVGNDVPDGKALLSLMLSEWYRKQYIAAEAKSWDIEAGESLLVDVGILSADGAPDVKAFALVEPKSDILAAGGKWDPARNIVKHYRDTFQVNSTKANINNIAKDAPVGDLFQHIRLGNPTGSVIDEVTIRVGGAEIFKRTKLRNDYELARHGMNPTADYFDIIPDLTDNPLDVWRIGGRKFEVEAKFTDVPGGAATVGTGNVKIITLREGQRE